MFLEAVKPIKTWRASWWAFTRKNEQKRLKTAPKKYFNQLLGAPSNWKLVEIHNSHLMPSIKKDLGIGEREGVIKRLSIKMLFFFRMVFAVGSVEAVLHHVAVDRRLLLHQVQFSFDNSCNCREHIWGGLLWGGSRYWRPDWGVCNWWSRSDYHVQVI